MFKITTSAIRHPFFRPPHLALDVNVQLIFGNPARAHIADEFYSGSLHRSQAPIAMYPTSLLGYALSCAIQYLISILSIYRLSYPSILSRLSLSSSTTSALCTYLVHGSYTRTVNCASTLQSTSCISQPKFISHIPVVYAPVSQIDHLPNGQLY